MQSDWRDARNSIALVLFWCAAMHASGATASPPAPSGPESIEAGALRVEFEPDPWRLRFTGADGAAVLVESSSREAAAAGATGFRSDGRWSHATRATTITHQPDGSIEAQVATDDPRGRALHVVLSRDGGEGVIAVVVEVRDPVPPDDPLAGVPAPLPPLEAVGVGWEAPRAGESFYGFGERANRVQHRGGEVESYVSDGPWQPDEYKLMSGILPAPGFRPRDDATYFPIPWLLSSRGYGVLVDADETVLHRLGTVQPDAWSFEVRGAPEDLAFRPAPSRVAFRVFGGPAPADALRRFTSRVGRQPRPLAPWVFGPWYQGSEEQVRALRAADAPLSVSQTYLHYLPCGGDRANEWPRNERLHALGVAVTTYFNPMVCQSYEAAFTKAAAAGGLIKDASGEPYIYTYFTTRPFLVSQYDFSAEAGRRAFADVLSQAVDDGHDGWMEDFGEYTPPDAVTADGREGSATHNRYVRDYHCAAYRFAREQDRPIVRFQRSGWTGAARCAQVVWGGDPTTGWGFDGLASVVRAGLGMGLSGVSLWGSDVGGFFSFYGRALDDDLLRRWVQLGAFSGVMRTERDGIAIPDYERPQVEQPQQIGNWRRYAKLRTQLYPYVAGADETYRNTGMPIMRHLLLGWPDDWRARGRDDEFLFGPDLLVAPVLEAAATMREAWLPAGDWIDLWRSVRWQESDGALVLRAPEVLHGNAQVVLPAPADEIPVLVRAGAILPMLPPWVDTLADYGWGTPGLVRLGDGPRTRDLLAFPRGHSSARLDRAARIFSDEIADGWRLDFHGPETSWRLQASLATLDRPLRPCAVEWKGRSLADDAWTWDDTQRVLRANFAGAGGRLVVRGCGSG